MKQNTLDPSNEEVNLSTERWFNLLSSDWIDYVGGDKLDAAKEGFRHGFVHGFRYAQKQERDCDTCEHDGDCYITMLKCKGYNKKITFYTPCLCEYRQEFIPDKGPVWVRKQTTACIIDHDS